MNAHATRTHGWLLVAAAAVALSGCASSAGTQAATSSPLATSSQSAASSTTDGVPSPSQSTAPLTDSPHSEPASSNATRGMCQTSELDVRTGQVTGGAGTFSVPLILTNTGEHDCTITGYPGVSYLASADGPQIGPAATRYGDSHGTVRLSAGGSATALVLTVNVGMISEQQCGPTPVAGLRIYPPDNDDSVFLPFTQFKTCSRSNALRVEAVEPGIRH